MVIKKLLESPTFKSERRREEVAILLKESCKGFTIVRNEKMKCTNQIEEAITKGVLRRITIHSYLYMLNHPASYLHCHPSTETYPFDRWRHANDFGTMHVKLRATSRTSRAGSR
ncbi:hypothetical protein YC2023_044831 [Brassica napus]